MINDSWSGLCLHDISFDLLINNNNFSPLFPMFLLRRAWALIKPIIIDERQDRRVSVSVSVSCIGEILERGQFIKSDLCNPKYQIQSFLLLVTLAFDLVRYGIYEHPCLWGQAR